MKRINYLYEDDEENFEYVEDDQMSNEEEDTYYLGDVYVGKSFTTYDGEYEYVRRIEDMYLDFDHWALWEVRKLIDYNGTSEEEEDSNKYYVVVEEDTGLVDYDPSNYESAKEFYDGKIEDYEEENDYDYEEDEELIDEDYPVIQYDDEEEKNDFINRRTKYYDENDEEDDFEEGEWYDYEFDESLEEKKEDKKNKKVNKDNKMMDKSEIDKDDLSECDKQEEVINEEINYEELLMDESLELSDIYKDNEDNKLHVKINGTEYAYTLNDDTPFTVEDLVHKVFKMSKFSHGKALQFLKRNAVGHKVNQ